MLQTAQSYRGMVTAPHHLAARGYRVGLIGKRHFGPPSAFPFDQLGPRGKNKGSTDAAASFNWFDPNAWASMMTPQAPAQAQQPQQ